MKIKSFLPLLAILIMCGGAQAFEVGDQVSLTNELSGKVLSKNGTGHKVEVFANPDNKPSGNLEIKNTYVISGETFTVIRIAEKGFESCDLTSVTVGAEMNLVGTRAFYGCTRLKAFFETERGSVSVIGDEAFSFTQSMNSARFPGVELVGQFAFMRSGLTNVEMPKVKEIKAGAFQECSKLTEFIGGEKLTSLGNIAFCNCPALTGITLGPSVSNVGATAFGFDVALKDIVIPEGLTTAGNSAFQGCGLERVFILSESVMDYCDDSKLLRNRSISNIYCVNGILDAVSNYLKTGSTENPVESLTTAKPVSIDNVLMLKPVGDSNVYEVVKGDFEISNLQVFDPVTNNEIQAADGRYTVTGDKVRLRYYVDGINLLEYETSLTKGTSSVISAIDTPDECNEYYTLTGVKVTAPEKGIYIYRSKDGSTRKVVF